MIFETHLKWAQEHQRGSWRSDMTDLKVAALRMKDEETRRAMCEIPPACLVRAREGLPVEMPAPGSVARVCGYRKQGGRLKIENPRLAVSGEMLILIEEPIEGPSGEILTIKKGWAKREWIEVVGYWAGFTPSAVRSLLGM